VNELKKALAILLMAALMLTASTLSVYADDDEEDEGEDDEGGSDDDGASGMPGFEVAFAIAGALAATRLIGRKNEFGFLNFFFHPSKLLRSI
jgi:PGF-CTERM protein